VSNTSSFSSVNKEDDLELQLNSYDEYLSTYVEGFMSNLFSQGIIDSIDSKKIKKYLSNPDKYQKEIEKIVQYFYIANAELFQLFEMVKILPSLNYKINAFDKTTNYEKNLAICDKILFQVKHKTLTRDMLSQQITAGTLIGIWLGKKKNYYPYIFDDLKLVFPAYRKNGEWVAVVDLSWFEKMNEAERLSQFSNFEGIIDQAEYEKYQADKSNKLLKYIELPTDRTFVLRTHTTKRNQNLGVSWGTTGLFDITHKEKLKNMEKSVANKIINALAVLTIGSEQEKDYSSLKLKSSVKKKVHSGVKEALEKNDSNGVTVIAIPEFAKLTFPDMNSDALDPDKFNSVNQDIQSAYGLSSALMNGSGSTFASAKLNLETLYKRIGVLLEEIERDVYGKLFNLILTNKDKDNYVMEYDKTMPISGEKRLESLHKLHSEGFSVKAIVDSLEGVHFEDYINQSVYEIDKMKLQEKIKPYLSSYTSSSSDSSSGRNEIETNDVESENTIKSKASNGNGNPDT
jgi:hypothetical protein